MTVVGVPWRRPAIHVASGLWRIITQRPRASCAFVRRHVGDGEKLAALHAIHAHSFPPRVALHAERLERIRNLKPRSEDLVLRIDSGDASVQGKRWDAALLIASGTSIYELIDAAVTTAAALSGTARPRTEKQLPASIDVFGWCTWDAFYSQVSAQGVHEGLESLARGGVRPRTLIIDDGWQMTEVDEDFAEANTTRVLRRMQFPATETIDEEFDDAEKSVLASYAERVPAGSEMMSFMPALNDEDYVRELRAAVRSRDDPDINGEMGEMLQRIDEMKRKTKLQVPEIERTVLKLTKQPRERALWSRLVQRIAGWLLGLLQVFFLIFYQYVVDPAMPNAWVVGFFEYIARGPLKGNMLVFFKASSDFTRRIISVKANGKFSRPGAPADQRQWFAEASDFRSVTDSLRRTFGLDFIYCWHGLPAYWGGVMPHSAEFEDFGPRVIFPKPPESLREIEPAMRWNPAVLAGVGVVDDSKGLYNSMHDYLSRSGVDGVKVDCQAGVGLVGSVIGGGPTLARQYHDALESSIAEYFPGNHAINCMSHSTENIYQMRDTAIARASDDFYPKEPSSSAPHVAACAYNSLFLSPLCQPDWDMFQSKHPAALLHATARAVSGGAVYVSDKVDRHDYDVLRKLVLRDGTVLRALRPGVPTADCIFTDPLRDESTLLKVWNENAVSGVVGVFHLQGSFWDRRSRRFTTASASPPPLSGSVRPCEVETLTAVEARLAHDMTGQYAVLTHRGERLGLLPSASESVAVNLAAGTADVVTIAPVMAGPQGQAFAPLGLVNMLNSGGAVTSWAAHDGGAQVNGSATAGWRHEVAVRGEGSFVAYCSERPSAVQVDGGVPDEFAWERESGRLTLVVSAPEGDDEGPADACVQHTVTVVM